MEQNEKERYSGSFPPSLFLMQPASVSLRKRGKRERGGGKAQTQWRAARRKNSPKEVSFWITEQGEGQLG